MCLLNIEAKGNSSMPPDSLLATPPETITVTNLVTKSVIGLLKNLQNLAFHVKPVELEKKGHRQKTTS
jgi:hypothetical protein